MATIIFKCLDTPSHYNATYKLAKELKKRSHRVIYIGHVSFRDFAKVRKTFTFKNGMERLWQGVEKGFVIALMCSESDPLDCHRFSMVSVGLIKDGFDVKHILKDKTLKEHKELEYVLLKKYDKKLPKPDMFNSDVSIDDQLKEAYKLKNKEIGFSPYSKQPQTENND